MTTSDDPVPADAPAAALPAEVHPALSAALEAQGYSQLTPVQQMMLDEAHAGADLLVSAQTGSGKTVAFGIAVADTLLGDADRFGQADKPLGLVIAPTRELALQVQRELDWLYAKAGIRTATAVGGLDIRGERRALERGAHLVVGTPGRLRDHITRNALDLSDMRAVVLDEADEMLDLGFREDLEFILASAPEDRRTLMFSATVPRAIAELAKTYQRDAVRVAAGAAREQHADIEYRLMLVRRDEREPAVINTLLGSDSQSAIVFCHTREAVRHLTARLANRGFAVVSLSGEMAQGERSNALQSMRDGRAHVCVATDVAARGIDLPNLDLVIHADVPSNPATLLHRSGRTGRAGRKGVCVLVVPENRRRAADRVLSIANLNAMVCAAPDVAEIEARYRKQIIDTAQGTTAPDESEAAFVAELIAQTTPEQLAAAFLRAQLAARPVPEEVSPVSIEPQRARREKKPGETWEPREREPREPRGPDMEGGVSFTLSLGRKQRADPKWLLPMICKAGGVGRRDVGAIRIHDTETVFEISADKADGFAESVKSGEGLEKGVRITRGGDASARGPKPAFKGKPKADWKPKEWKKDGPKERFKDRPKGTKGSFDPASKKPRHKPRGATRPD
ncbi:MAG: DEAD/DEAH box helicase [Methylobacterium mesophilicum]|nr:DEAD/DEAH box helicase [Methylobacterium mesophilicum]